MECVCGCVMGYIITTRHYQGGSPENMAVIRNNGWSVCVGVSWGT